MRYLHFSNHIDFICYYAIKRKKWIETYFSYLRFSVFTINGLPACVATRSYKSGPQGTKKLPIKLERSLCLFQTMIILFSRPQLPIKHTICLRIRMHQTFKTFFLHNNVCYIIYLRYFVQFFTHVLQQLRNVAFSFIEFKFFIVEYPLRYLHSM